MKNFLTLAALLAFTSLATASPADIPIEDFMRFSEVNTVTLSPTGEYLAVTVPRDRQTGLVVLNVETLEVLSAKTFDDDMHASWVEWTSDDRLIGGLAYQTQYLEQPLNYGELYSVSKDGDRLRYLVGYQGRQGISGGQATASASFASLVSAMSHDPDHAIISTYPLREGDRGYLTAHRIKVNGGKRTQLVRAPQSGGGSFLADQSGAIRYFAGPTDNGVGINAYVRDQEAQEWKKIEYPDLNDIAPLTFDANGTVYFTANAAHGRRCLYSDTLSGDKLTEMACHATADLQLVAMDSSGSTPIAAYFQPGAFEVVNVAPDHPEARLLAAIQQRFKTSVVYPTSWSDDGNRLVFWVFSDKTPGEYFLYDREARKVRFLMAARSWIDPASMAQRLPIQYESGDGTPIHGYLTLPQGETRAGPMVVMPHGGPIGIRDTWGWDANAQLLASRGYTVLQVNYRGSAGYGSEFLQQGRRQWATGMIDDIIAGTRWAIEQGYADPSRICTAGGSYGAYSSLMSVLREADLFQCVIGYAGVYDLNTLARNSDIQTRDRGKRYFSDFIGESKEELAAQSPLNFIDQLQVPMLIVHGKDDVRTPFSEAKALRNALEDRNHPYEWLVKDREGHGFYLLENRVEYYETALDFLGRHIGSGN